MASVGFEMRWNRLVALIRDGLDSVGEEGEGERATEMIRTTNKI